MNDVMTYGAEHLLACCMEHPEITIDYNMSGRLGDAIFEAMYKAICGSYEEYGTATPEEVIRRMERDGISQNNALELYGRIAGIVPLGVENDISLLNGRWYQARAASALEKVKNLSPGEVSAALPSILGTLEEEEHEKVKGIADYLNKDFAGDVKENSHIWKTGFSSLDEAWGGLHAGLYVIGAPSSVGKTTFCLQLADQVAASGEHVLFFSLEQTRAEMACKSLARYAAQGIGKGFHRNTEALSAMEIRSGISSRAVEKAKEKYIQDVENRMTVVANIFGSTISDITHYVKSYVQRYKVKPLVLVDYLQIIQSDKDQEVRQNIDYYMGELKKLSNNGFPVVVISAYNRSNYEKTGSFECFKESGGIEYSADVVCTLELSVIKDLDEVPEGRKRRMSTNKKREKVDTAKQEPERDITFKWLKNRYGIATGQAEFKYWSKYEWFIDAENPYLNFN